MILKLAAMMMERCGRMSERIEFDVAIELDQGKKPTLVAEPKSDKELSSWAEDILHDHMMYLYLGYRYHNKGDL